MLKTELKARTAVYLPLAVLEELDQHLLAAYGYVKGPRSAFIIKAIRERLEREKALMLLQKSKKGG